MELTVEVTRLIYTVLFTSFWKEAYDAPENADLCITEFAIP